jgi:hypothetical protein
MTGKFRGRLFAGALVTALSIAGLSAGFTAPAGAVTSRTPGAGNELAHAAATAAQQPSDASLQTSSEPTLAPSGYSPDGTPIYHVTSPVLLAHSCEVLGDDSSDQAVTCADIYAQPSPNVTNEVQVFAEEEGFCQNLGNLNDYPACAGDQIYFGLNDSSGDNLNGEWVGACGHYADNNPCVNNGREIYVAGDWGYETAPLGCSPPLWTDVWAGPPYYSKIRLPVTADTESAIVNLASGHVIVCN